MGKKDKQEDIARVTAMVQSALGAHLESLILYGSVVQGITDGQFSDVNLLCVVDEISAERLETLAPALAWWARQKYPPMVLLSRDEQRDSSDVFPLEYLDIMHQRRVLAGRDCFADVPRHPQLHRLQVEHDLRTQLIRLRGAYALAQDDAGKLEQLLLQSLVTFLVLFRHALLVVGEPLVLQLEPIIAAAAARFNFDPGPWRRLLDARMNSQRLPKDEVKRMFFSYLHDIQAVERALERHGKQS